MNTKFGTKKKTIYIILDQKFSKTTQILNLKYIFIDFAVPNYRLYSP